MKAVVPQFVRLWTLYVGFQGGDPMWLAPEKHLSEWYYGRKLSVKSQRTDLACGCY